MQKEMSEEIEQYLEIFIQEAKEQLEIITQSLLELEKNPKNQEVINEIFRAAHTLKGSSGMMGFTDIQELTHKMEDVFDSIRKGLMKPSPDLIDILFECVDALEKRINHLEMGERKEEDFSYLVEKIESCITEKRDTNEEEEISPSLSMEELKALEAEVNSLGNAGECFFVTVRLNEDCLFKSARAYMIITALEKIGKIVRCFPEIKKIEDGKFNEATFNILVMTDYGKEKIEEVVKKVSEVSDVKIKRFKEELQEKGAKPIDIQNKEVHLEPKIEVDFSAVQTIRVRREELDKLMNLVGELIINKIQLLRLSSDYKLDSLKTTLDSIDRLTSELHNLVMRIRMVPVGHIFNRFPRLVRDIARKLGKKVNFIIEGKEIEVDRTVLDEIGEPLLHLLRNAIDHGIEPPEKREKIGKPPEGTVKLTAERKKDHILITVEDDGAGLDPEKIKRKALEKGIISEAESKVMTAQQLIDLIFLPGFSTSEKVTETSGRGVGMDIVKTKIESLGGTVQIESAVGKGTKVTLTLPLTLAIVKAILIKVADQTYAIPLNHIDEVIRIKKSELKKIGDVSAINLRGNILPVFHLRKILGYMDLETEEYNAVVINRDPINFGLIVDSIVGMQEIVIKTLDESLKKIEGIAGVTILGDGQVVLILDPANLIGRKRKDAILRILS